MRVLIAPDKFKGSLTAGEVCRCIRKGILLAVPGAEIMEKPMADGGEGSVELLTESLSLHAVGIDTADPLGRPIRAEYFRNEDIACIEMAAASGLERLEDGERNPMMTSTFGTGLMIRDALEKGIRKVILFIGGSATNDAGMGVAAALGYRFLDKEGIPLKPAGACLGEVAGIDTDGVMDAVKETGFSVVCDVQNPFYGPLGAAAVYAVQKGAAPAQVEALDHGLKSFARIVQDDLGMDIAHLPGSGAAGGMGGGAVAFLGADLVRGIDFMITALGVEEAIRSADLVITGEGKIDQQTLYGKVVSGIARFAKKHQKRCIAFCGVSEIDDLAMKSLGLEDLIPMVGTSFSIRESMAEPAQVLEAAVGRYFRGIDQT